MRSSPIRRVSNSALPTPVVSQAIVRQPVNLKPRGNTVEVTTLSDNPFEGKQTYTVYTQQSGGMAKPDPQQQSRSLRHGWMPGLGEDPPAAGAQPAGVLDFLSTAANTAVNLATAKDQARIAQAKAALAQAQAMAAAGNRSAVPAPARSSLTIPLIIGGVAVVGLVGFLLLRKRGSAAA